jgi:hypothetical protein
MNNPNNSQSRETVTTRAKIMDYPVDLPVIMSQIRLCRSTLGAILDELECVEASGDTIEKIADCTTGVTAEIESLWEATKQPD